MSGSVEISIQEQQHPVADAAMRRWYCWLLSYCYYCCERTGLSISAAANYLAPHSTHSAAQLPTAHLSSTTVCCSCHQYHSRSLLLQTLPISLLPLLTGAAAYPLLCHTVLPYSAATSPHQADCAVSTSSRCHVCPSHCRSTSFVCSCLGTFQITAGITEAEQSRLQQQQP